MFSNSFVLTTSENQRVPCIYSLLDYLLHPRAEPLTQLPSTCRAMRKLWAATLTQCARATSAKAHPCCRPMRTSSPPWKMRERSPPPPTPLRTPLLTIPLRRLQSPRPAGNRACPPAAAAGPAACYGPYGWGGSSRTSCTWRTSASKSAAPLRIRWPLNPSLHHRSTTIRCQSWSSVLHSFPVPN